MINLTNIPTKALLFVCILTWNEVISFLSQHNMACYTAMHKGVGAAAALLRLTTLRRGSCCLEGLLLESVRSCFFTL